MTKQLSEMRQAMEQKDKNCAELTTLLNEAGEEYTEKDTEIKSLKEKLTKLSVRKVFFCKTVAECSSLHATK